MSCFHIHVRNATPCSGETEQIDVDATGKTVQSITRAMIDNRFTTPLPPVPKEARRMMVCQVHRELHA